MIIREFEATVKRAGSEDVNIPIKCTLSYDADDPFAVVAIFSARNEEDRVWHFSRELLAKGAHSLVSHGSGDVKFRLFPLQGIVMVCLRVPEGHADVALPAFEVHEFLADANAAAQAGEEECGALVDDFLKELFEA